MVWAGTYNSKTELVTMQGTLHAARYCDEVVLSMIEPFYVLMTD